MSDYTYWQCPECEFNTVLPRNTLDAVVPVCCLLCGTDSGHIVEMRPRQARDDDKPEGYDARGRR